MENMKKGCVAGAARFFHAFTYVSADKSAYVCLAAFFQNTQQQLCAKYLVA